jgi:hypothetical protein
MRREDMAEFASRIANTTPLPEPGCRLVVVVTDAAGDFLGAAGNTDNGDMARILWCALYGADRIDHKSTLPPDKRRATKLSRRRIG